MHQGLRPSLLLPALLAAALQLPAPAQAGCSRVIKVPAAPTGHAVTFKHDEEGGLFPEMLKVISAKTGCQFKWSVVPRIRLEAMFEAGSADLLVAVTQLDRRDKHGVFVPVVESRPTLISIASNRPPIHNFAQLLAQRELRVALVRGYDYGAEYRELMKTLAAQGRLYMEPDSLSIGRLMAGGMADVTIMPASSFIGALKDDRRVDGLAERLRTEPLDELPWIKAGVYLSKKSLTKADRDLLENALLASVKSGAWWTTFRKYFPPSTLGEHARPLGSAR
jgi:polar amino acid transport system substrate-binding protein